MPKLEAPRFRPLTEIEGVVDVAALGPDGAPGCMNPGPARLQDRPAGGAAAAAGSGTS
jgi:hypothetical protein